VDLIATSSRLSTKRSLLERTLLRFLLYPLASTDFCLLEHSPQEQQHPSARSTLFESEAHTAIPDVLDEFGNVHATGIGDLILTKEKALNSIQTCEWKNKELAKF
jgi:hypothetical protein